MTKSKIGISDIGLYVPHSAMDLQTLAKERIRWQPRLERHLDRAIRVTGQNKIRFPSVWEDTATIAAEAAYVLLKENKPEQLRKLRYIAAGTETGLDHSKPVSAYVQGMLKKSGINVPDSLSSFQVQHACAGGTLALLSVASMLSMSNREETGLVIASDISRYESETTAEITQGAGAAALLVDTNPKLLEFDLSSVGYCSQDVDDFFRPLHSKTAKVKGRYSMECYFQNLESAFADHCERSGKHPSEVLEETDMFVLHTPFSLLPESGMKKLLNTHLGYSDEQAVQFLEGKAFYDGIRAIADIGNTYTASMYIVLAHILDAEYKKLGNDIIGKKVLFASYGSGNTMIIFSATVAEAAPQVISNWDLGTINDTERTASWADYNLWLNGPFDIDTLNTVLDEVHPADGDFALRSVRKDGYREYVYIDQIERFRAKPEKPAELIKSEAVSV